ncbi:hypothetical protein FRB94_003800 [Tulasnella sp. JGI-2019a]|nr:hypothetical protein FRB93_005013 [Tulasnella sp. JGI-2019a]KAG9002537.1 hypothetical protein FRB94_003800 [Tulasnella sp. JGI-2019a]
MTGFSALPASSASSAGGSWSGVARVKGPRWARMPLLTIGMLGLQIVWSVEMGYAPPYLLSLGLSKALMSIVFVAGPLSGLIMQPLIGVLADHSTSRFGRRRPYMLGGSLVCVAALFLLGFTRWFSGIFVAAGTKANNVLTIALAVWSIYCIDFSINAVQAADRALLVDLLPPSQQEVGNAWAGRMFGLGSVAGFFIGNVDLTKTLPWLGKTQLQILSVLTSLSLVGAHGLTSAGVTEKVLIKDSNQDGRGSFLDIFKDIWHNILTLPPVILQICIIQFFSWIAWFPVLFFSTVWVGEIYTKEKLALNPNISTTTDAFLAEATRAGSSALLWSSILSFGASIILPFVVVQSSIEDPHPHSHIAHREMGGGGRGSDWVKIKDWLLGMKIHLATLWAVSHVLFAITMFLTYLSTSVASASALITLTGFCWAVTQWVPFSLLGEAILVTVPPGNYDPTDDAPIPLADHRSHRPHTTDAHDGSDAERQTLMFSADAEFADQPHEVPSARPVTPPPGRSRPRIRSPFGSNGGRDGSETDIQQLLTPASSRNSSADTTPLASTLEAANGGESLRSTESDDGDERADMIEAQGGGGGGGISDKAGIILGIHNIFVVIPQFLVTGLSSILFALLEPEHSVLDQGHAGHPAAGNIPAAKNATDIAAAAVAAVSSRTLLLVRDAPVEAAGSDSIGIIFRVGGVSAAIAGLLCWRLSRTLMKMKGR